MEANLGVKRSTLYTTTNIDLYRPTFAMSNFTNRDSFYGVIHKCVRKSTLYVENVGKYILQDIQVTSVPNYTCVNLIYLK